MTDPNSLANCKLSTIDPSPSASIRLRKDLKEFLSPDEWERIASSLPAVFADDSNRRSFLLSTNSRIARGALSPTR